MNDAESRREPAAIRRIVADTQAIAFNNSSFDAPADIGVQPPTSVASSAQSGVAGHARKAHDVVSEARMKLLVGLAIGLLATPLGAQTATDDTAIRGIVQDAIAAWNRGDAVAYSRHFATDGTFTNITGQFFRGYEAFLRQHEVIFAGRFKQTRLPQDIVSLKFVRPDVAVVEMITAVAGVVAGQLAPGTAGDATGRLRTRLLQVVVKHGEEWTVVAYHNVDVKPGIPIPELR